MTEYSVPDTRIWWYLSFSSARDFEAAAFVAADSFQGAVEAACAFGAKEEWWVLGGNVSGLAMPPESDRGRLLSLNDLARLFGRREMVKVSADDELVEMMRKADA
jgi:hypothetical protein